MKIRLALVAVVGVLSLSAEAGGVIEDKTAFKASAKQSTQARTATAAHATVKTVKTSTGNSASKQKAQASAKATR